MFHVPFFKFLCRLKENTQDNCGNCRNNSPPAESIEALKDMFFLSFLAISIRIFNRTKLCASFGANFFNRPWRWSRRGATDRKTEDLLTGFFEPKTNRVSCISPIRISLWSQWRDPCLWRGFPALATDATATPGK